MYEYSVYILVFAEPSSRAGLLLAVDQTQEANSLTFSLAVQPAWPFLLYYFLLLLRGRFSPRVKEWPSPGGRRSPAGGLSALQRAVQQDTAAAENTPSPPQRQSGNVFNRMTTVDESDVGVAREPPSAGIVVRGGGRDDNTAGSHPTSFSAMMRASKARAAATGGGNAGRDATLRGNFGCGIRVRPRRGLDEQEAHFNEGER